MTALLLFFHIISLLHTVFAWMHLLFSFILFFSIPPIYHATYVTNHFYDPFITVFGGKHVRFSFFFFFLFFLFLSCYYFLSYARWAISLEMRAACLHLDTRKYWLKLNWHEAEVRFERIGGGYR